VAAVVVEAAAGLLLAVEDSPEGARDMPGVFEVVFEVVLLVYGVLSRSRDFMLRMREEASGLVAMTPKEVFRDGSDTTEVVVEAEVEVEAEVDAEEVVEVEARKVLVAVCSRLRGVNRRLPRALDSPG
jgi:hypothetical protein